MHSIGAGSYLINLGSPDKGMLAKSYAAFLEELQRCETLGIRMYNIHPGHSNRLLLTLHLPIMSHCCVCHSKSVLILHCFDC